MSRTSIWQQSVLPAAVVITVSMWTAPGMPMSVHMQSSLGDVIDNSQTKSDSNWAEKNMSLRILSDIQGLEQDWDGYGAEKIPDSVILLARNLVASLDHQPEIYPTKRRTVQMQYELSDRSYLEFEIYTDKIEVLSVPQRDYEKAQEYSVDANRYYEIRDIVNSFYA